MKRGEIGHKLAEFRKMRRMSQENVGEAFGVSRAAISDMERGITKIDIPDLEKLCKILDVSILRFMPVHAPVTANEAELLGHYREIIGEEWREAAQDIIKGFAERSRREDQATVAEAPQLAPRGRGLS